MTRRREMNGGLREVPKRLGVVPKLERIGTALTSAIKMSFFNFAGNGRNVLSVFVLCARAGLAALANCPVDTISTGDASRSGAKRAPLAPHAVTPCGRRPARHDGGRRPFHRTAIFTCCCLPHFTSMLSPRPTDSVYTTLVSERLHASAATALCGSSCASCNASVCQQLPPIS